MRKAAAAAPFSGMLLLPQLFALHLPLHRPPDEGIGKHAFLHTALSHFLKESLVKNTLPPPDLPLWMYGCIEYLILENRGGLYM